MPGFTTVLAGTLGFFGVFLTVRLILPVVSLFCIIQSAAIVLLKKNKTKMDYAPGEPNYEVDATYFLPALVLFVIGAGAMSLDSVLGV